MTDRASDNMAETLPDRPDVEAVLSASRMLYEEVAGQALPAGLSAPDGTGRDWYTLSEAMLRGVSAGISSAGADLAAAIHTAAAERAWHSAVNVAPQAAESGRTVIQYITLRSDDETPYETARAIRRESEALLRA